MSEPNWWHWIIDEPKFTYAEKLVALVYVRHQGRTGWSWPSPGRISRLCGLSKTTVWRATRSLEAKNAIEKDIAEDGFVSYRIRQSQGLLFSTANSMWKSSGNADNAGANQSLGGFTRKQGGFTQKPEVRIEPEDRKPKPSRAHPARGSQLWKLDAKAKRLIAEIQYLRTTIVGCGPSDLGQIEYTERRIGQLRMELERIGCYEIEKAG